MVARKVKAALNAADEGLVGMLIDLSPGQSLVYQLDRFPQFVAGWRQNHPVVHKTGVKQAQGCQPFLQGLQVQCPHQR